MIKKIIKIAYLIITIAIIWTQNIFAMSFDGEDIWIGWLDMQYGCLSYGAVANENDKNDRNEKIDLKDKQGKKIKLEKYNDSGYGRYKFNYKEDLVDFMKYADDIYFKNWIEMGKNTERLNSDAYGLPDAWTKYFKENGNAFAYKQDMYIYEKYYKRFADELETKEKIDISPLNEYAKGFILCMVIAECGRNPESPTNIFTIPMIYVKDAYKDIKSSDEFIKKLYERIIQAMDGVSEKDGKSIKIRKYKQCKQMYDDRIGDIETETKIGELLYRRPEGIDNYTLSKLNKENPDMFNFFLSNNRFYNSQTVEWFDSLRNSGNYEKDFGIKSGEIDFTNATTQGLETSYKIPSSAEDTVYKTIQGTNIPYIPNNSQKEYSKIEFGRNNIAQSGALVSCICMAESKLKHTLITIDKMIEKVGKTTYDKEMKNNAEMVIMQQMAQAYGFNIEKISEGEVKNTIGQTNKVIMAKVKDCEFTTKETYIIICSPEKIEQNMYVRIVNPNINQFNTNYYLYKLDYIIENCKAEFFEIM